ncbi:hypothetical protein [Candidatus Sororendozoicomonas aggregata]|uniref:hypothetical protein n=1 Tax=Candidatus Sororendozoicomonas aggregata TaxID=3073239 RepID=UPI002ED32432
MASTVMGVHRWKYRWLEKQFGRKNLWRNFDLADTGHRLKIGNCYSSFFRLLVYHPK